MTLMDLPVALGDDSFERLVFDRLHALEEQARQIAAARDIALRRATTAEKRLAEVEGDFRAWRKAHEDCPRDAADVTPTLELPRCAPDPDPAPDPEAGPPPRFWRRGRHQ